MRTIFPLCLCLTMAVAAQERVVFEEQPALRLSNDKLQLTVLPEGGAMVQLSLVGDADNINPLWNPIRLAGEAALCDVLTGGRLEMGLHSRQGG